MELLLNWIAQGGVVVLAAAAVLRVIPHARTQARYSFAWAACVVVLGLPAVPHVIAMAFPVHGAGEAAVALRPVVSMPTTWWTSSAFAIVLWLTWCGVCGVRLAAAASALRTTRRQCRDCPPAVQRRFHHWSRVRASGRQTRLVLSTGVHPAAVLGGGAPMIALAPALLEHLSDDDLDRVVIHEWAHVQRRDDVAQLIERIVCMVAGWHPAVWWLQRQLELEREVACDEIAVALTGSAKGYAACLANLAALRLPPVHSLRALAVGSSSGLRRRVVRILAAGGSTSGRRWRAIALCSSFALACLALAVGSVHVAESVATDSSLSGAARPSIAEESATLVSATVPLAQTSSALTPVAAGRWHSGEYVRPAKRETDPSGVVAATAPVTEWPRTAAVATLPSQSLGWLIGMPSTVLTSPTAAAPVNSPTETHAAAHGGEAPPPADEKPPEPWAAVADAAVAVGRGSQSAGVATAGFFRRFGKQIAGSF